MMVNSTEGESLSGFTSLNVSNKFIFSEPAVIAVVMEQQLSMASR